MSTGDSNHGLVYNTLLSKGGTSDCQQMCAKMNWILILLSLYSNDLFT